MSWKVYDKTGETERCEVKKLEYSGTWMGECYVTATVEASAPIGFSVFDYLTYRGERFELEMIPTVKKTSRYQYTYDLRFVSMKYELERCQMRDLVPYDNGVVYPTPLTIEFTGTVEYLAERIQACMDALYGTGVWSITVADGVESEEKNISLSNTNCWNALTLVNTEYGLNFYVSGRTVTIGDEQPVISHTFEYGKGNGLYEIERVADTDTGVVTKLRAYGGTRNLDSSYPKKPEWPDSALESTFVLSPLRLMLPSFKTDGKTDYVLADDELVAQYGIREASITYDDIYPSITGMTNSTGQRIDKLKSVTPVTDNDAHTFEVEVYDLGFDLEENLTTEDAQLNIKTGTLQGYTFNITDIEPLTGGGYKLTLGRNTLSEGDTGNFTVPNTDLNAEAGDEFVLLNILMPKAYIEAAEERLEARAEEYLAQYGQTNYTYNIGVDEIFMAKNPTLLSTIKEGKKLTLKDTAIGIASKNITVQSVTIREGESLAPEVSITLNDKPSAGTLERIQGQISDIESTVSNNFSSQTELAQQYRRKLDKEVWDSVFIRHYDNPDNPYEVTSLECIVGFWGDSYISALGLNPDAGSTPGGSTTLAGLTDVSITGTPGDGQVLAFDAALGKWKPADATAGLDEEELAQYLTTNNYAKKTDITAALAGYAKQEWVTGQGYALKTTRVIAGTGLTGGGTLAADRTLSLATVGTAGTYTKVTVDSYGRVTGHASLTQGDIPALAISKITGLQTALDAKLNKSVFEELFEKVWVSGYGYAIRAKMAFYSEGWISTKGQNPDAGSTTGGVDEAGVLDILTKHGYATQSWVTGRGYITSSALSGYLTQNTADERYIRKNLGVLGDNTNFNDYGASGLYFVSSSNIGSLTNFPMNSNYGYGILANLMNAEKVGIQWYVPDYNNNMSVRMSFDGSRWNSWHILLTDLNIGRYALTPSNYTNYTVTKTGAGASGTWGIGISGNASTATRLQTARSLWGKPFDGAANVAGDIMDAGSILPSRNFVYNLGSEALAWNILYCGIVDVDSYIQIGSARLLYDSVNNALYVQKSDGSTCGFYATGFMSAKGLNSDAGSTVAGTTTLNGLSDVTISSPSNGQSLVYRNGVWKNEMASGGGSASVAWDDITGIPDWIGDLSPTFSVTSSASTNLNLKIGSQSRPITALYATYLGGTTKAGLFSDLTYSGNTLTIIIGGTRRTATIETSGGGASSVSVSSSSSRNVSVTVDGVTDYVNDLYATYSTYADQLRTARTIWGKSFNGSANIGGDIRDVGSIFPSSNYVYNLGSSSQAWNMLYCGVGIIDAYLKVGSGPYNSNYKLHVNGIAYASGGFQNGSDIRYKHILRDIPLTVEDVANAPSFIFRWTDDTAPGEQAGTSAQYWQPLLPQVVTEADGRLSMQYGKAAMAAVITTARTVVDHETRIRDLEQKMNRLTAE